MKRKSFFQKVSRRLSSLSYQARGMMTALSMKQKIHFLLLCIRHAKSLVKTDRFLSVDEALAKSIDVLHANISGHEILIPFREMEEALNRVWNDGASLELVRELFGNNEYIRKFRKGLQANTAFDIGSNRGFFVLAASKLLNSKKIVCVEPQKELQPVRHLLANANKIPASHLVEYNQFCSATSSNNSVSINEIMKENNLSQIDFLKMDVEGAEADIFSANLEWLPRCKNIAMEIHYLFAKVDFIPDLLTSKGFQVVLTDLQGRPIPKSATKNLPRGCAYLYASSAGDLI